MTYSAKANPNATNSEMDSKRIITHKDLTDDQIYDIIKQYVEIKVDRMDTQELIERVTQDLTDWYSDFTLDELKDAIDVNDDGLYDELVDNVTNETFIDVNNNGGKY